MDGILASAIVCTHNPSRYIFVQTLKSLQAQRYPKHLWELIIVDNASDSGTVRANDVAWHPNGRVVREEELGLTPARLRGMREASAPLLIYVDDDNFLSKLFVKTAIARMKDHSEVGVAGGKCLPDYEVSPQPFVLENLSILACRDLGNRALIGGWDERPEGRRYPSFAPVGAGMVVRREVMDVYTEQLKNSTMRSAFDRRGKSLASAGDNDLVMTALDAGWQAAYFPDLELNHYLPRERFRREYVARLAYETNRTWILALGLHGIRPWSRLPRWAIPAMRLRGYLREKPWTSDSAYIRWRGYCGQVEGRAGLR